MSFLYTTRLLDLIYVPLKYDKIISYGSHGLQMILAPGETTTLSRSKSYLSYTRHAYWSSSSSIPDIIKLFHTVWKLRPAYNFGFRRDNYITKSVRVVSLASDTCSGPYLCFYQIIKLFQTIKKSWNAQELGLEIRSGEISRKRTEQELSFLHVTLLIDLIYVPTIYYHTISNSTWLMDCTRFGLQGVQLHNKESESGFFCMQHAHWSSTSFLPNIIKLSQTVWELQPAQYFSFRGDNYITKSVRVVSLARDIPTGPPLQSNQILSKYV